jgi:23S rRNA (adenine2503-C2)-methyltransferase
LLRLPAVERVVKEEGPFGTTAKALLRLDDGQRVECVRIPVARRVPNPGRATLCVSAQVGCRMGCVFCESGRRGFSRDLRPDEIVGQYAAARLILGWDIGQIVFMGMGEPLDNFEGLAGALAVFLDESGPAFSQDDITVCTIGLPEGIARLRGLGLKRLNLSVSLNAPDERLRAELMPASRCVGLEALAAALARYPQRRNFALAVNYCLIPGRNDGAGAAEGVAAFLRAAAPSGRAVVNLIPYNPGPSPIGPAPSEAEIGSFTRSLQAAGALVKLRSPRGRALMAACGQLGRVD